MQVMKQQLELDMEQQSGSKPGKEYVKAVHFTFFLFFFLTYIKGTSWEMQDCMKPKLESRLPG